MDGRTKAYPLFGLAGVALVAIGLAYLLVVVMGTSGQGASTRNTSPTTASAAAEDVWGIKIKRVSLVAGGGLIDLRYEVVDVEKAKAALGPSSAHAGHVSADPNIVALLPLLIDDSTQQAVTEAHLHQSGRSVKQRLNPRLGVERFIFFNNTGGLVQKGDKLTLAIGQARVMGLVAQ